MNPQNQRTTQAHNDLKNVLLAGRILLNGMPLTGNELGILIQEEQMLFEKASKFDASQESVKPPQGNKKSKTPEKKE